MREPVALQHEPRVQLDARGEQCLLVAEQAQVRGLRDVAANGGRGRRSGGARRAEHLDAIAGRADVVDHDMVGIHWPRGLSEQHERRAGTEPGDLQRVDARGVEDDAVDETLLAIADDGALGLDVVERLLDEDAIAAATRLLADVPGELREVELVDLGDRERDHPGLAGRESAGRQVGPVAELVDRRLHPIAHRDRDVLVVVHDVRDRLHRDAGEIRHVL